MRSQEVPAESDDSESMRLKTAEFTKRMKILNESSMKKRRQRMEMNKKQVMKMRALSKKRVVQYWTVKGSSNVLTKVSKKSADSTSPSQPLRRSKRLQIQGTGAFPEANAAVQGQKKKPPVGSSVSWPAFWRMSRSHRALQNNRNEELKRQNAARSERLAKRRKIIEQNEVNMGSSGVSVARNDA